MRKGNERWRGRKKNEGLIGRKKMTEREFDGGRQVENDKE